MCEFPSWIETPEGKKVWLTDHDIAQAIEDGTLKSWDDSTGHSAIEKLTGAKGKHCEGRDGLPAGFASDIRAGKCNRMARVEPGHALSFVSDLLPPGMMDNLEVVTLLVRSPRLTSLPEGLKVKGWLDLSDCTALTSLPKGLTVGGLLALPGCTALTSLPEGLEIGGRLDLRGCASLTSLPEGLTVGGSLDLSGCTALTALPEGLTVVGRLDIRGCTSLTSLPEGLTVGGWLGLTGCTALKLTATQKKRFASKIVN